MENSTILREIADFDVRAPISVTICFEDDFDEKLIKTELETDDCQKETQDIDNSAFVSRLEPKEEILAETLTPCISNEEQNNFHDTTTYQLENLQEKSEKDTLRKRKTKDVQHCKAKRGKSESDTEVKIYEKKNTSSKNGNDSQTDSNLPTVENADENSVANPPVNPSVPETDTTAGQFENPVGISGLSQTEINEINAYVKNCLASFSNNMACIIKGYYYYKRHQITKESFNQMKRRCFNLSYKTLVTILLPEENNAAFIRTFLNDTVKNVLQSPSPNSPTATYRDYANLLAEMLMWVKQNKQQFSQEAHISTNLKENPVPATQAEKSQTGGLELKKYPALDARTESLDVDFSNTNKVCIYSSGPPGREFSLNIDSVKYLEVKNQKRSAEVGTVQPSCETNRPELRNENDQVPAQNGVPVESQKKSTATYNNHTIQQLRNNENDQVSAQIEALVESLKKSSATFNNHNIQQPVTQTKAPPGPNPAAARLQQHPQFLNTTTGNILNHSIPTQQTRARAPLLSMQLEMQHVPPFLERLQHLQKEVTRPAPPPYGNSRHLQAQTHSISPQSHYKQSRHLPAQLEQQQQTPSQFAQCQSGQNQQTLAQYDLTQFIQTQRTPPQYYQSQPVQTQFGQTQQMPPQFGQSLNLQMQLGQSQQPFSQYVQPRQSQQDSRQSRQLTQQRLTERFPSMATLLSMESRLAPPYPAIIEQSQIPQQAQPRRHRTEWHQEQNSNCQTQVAPQTQKGSPRSASTDSGFISPLNFNVSMDQTMPTTPQEPDPSLPLITHVTSLSEKVAYTELGICIVCKKSTKQMCMGCMKVYYCTYQCQSQDWTSHAPYCTRQTTS